MTLLFSKDPQELSRAQEIWDSSGYQAFFDKIIASPELENSLSAPWYKRSEELLSSYKIRPIEIRDAELRGILRGHLHTLIRGAHLEIPRRADRDDRLEAVRGFMAQKIFNHYLKYDIICLQEADYLDESMFPRGYEVCFADNDHSINGIAWNKERFELIEVIGDIEGSAFVLALRDKQSGKGVLVASSHLAGCNPFTAAIDPSTGLSDSLTGDHELGSIAQELTSHAAEIKIIAMDSNVTATHPRMRLIKDLGYEIDYRNFLEPTCTNPYQLLNTRIDWIAITSEVETPATISNIPVLSVGLNSLETNISDHKPVAARVSY